MVWAMRTRIWIVVLATACTSADDTGAPLAPLPLDEALTAGQVRAGLIVDDKALIGGVSARGRPGDFKIYNSKVRFIIGAADHATGYNPHGGAVLDADLVRPAGEPGQSNYGEVLVGVDLAVLKPTTIEVINDGRDGKAARVRVQGEEGVLPLFDVLTSQLLEPEVHEVDFSVDYILEPDSDVLTLQYSVFNRGKQVIEFGSRLSGFLFAGQGALPFVRGFGYEVPGGGELVDYFAAVADGVTYIYGREGVKLNVFITRSGVTAANHGAEFTLRPRDTFTWNDLLVVGDGNLAATQARWRAASGESARPAIKGRVTYPSGDPVAGARVHLLQPDASERDYLSTARTGADGRYELFAEPADYRLQVSRVDHTNSVVQTVKVTASGATLDFTLDRPGLVQYELRDDANRLLPAKITVRPEQGGANRLPSRYGQPPEPGGVIKTEYGHSGQGNFQLPAGTHNLWISRGGEYTLDQQTITVKSGETTSLASTLTRVVDTTGWMSTDTHIHSSKSPDSPDLNPFKVQAMVVEGLEMPISTEHEWIGDFNPAINELAVGDWMQGVVGSEITTFTYGHFNAWPLVPDPSKPGNGRIDWFYKDPVDTFAAIHANPGQPFLQVNHPRSAAIGGYFSAMGYDAETGTARRDVFSMDFDGIEVANGCNVSGIEAEEMVDWFSFLNRGHKKWALGSTDSHKARFGQMGYPRTYVKMSTDDPKLGKVSEFRQNMLAGHMMVTCGPFFEMTLGQAGIGDTVAVTGGTVTVSTRVAAPEWMDVDQIEIIVNGDVVATATIAETTNVERYAGDLTVPVPAGRDGWVIMRVRGDRSHSTWARWWPSWGFTNPIFLDGDGDGAWTMRR